MLHKASAVEKMSSSNKVDRRPMGIHGRSETTEDVALQVCRVPLKGQ